MHARALRATGCALALLAPAALTGCADDDERPGGERPPVTITVTAAIAGGRIEVSPRRFGAGPIRLIVSNQTRAERTLTFATGGDDAGITGTTQPIQPSGTGTLEVAVAEGDYEISADGPGVRPATVRVGAPRESAQNQLLLP